MKDMSELPADLYKLAAETKTLVVMLPKIIGTEGVNFTRDNFKNEGFNEGAEPWAKRERENRRSAGKKVLSDRRILYNSISYQVVGGVITIGVDNDLVPYAKLHNEGGTVEITEKQRRFFWAKYNEQKGKLQKSVDKKKIGWRNKRAWEIADEGLFWRSMALAKGPLKYPKRQFLGASPLFWKRVEAQIKDKLDNVFKKYKLL